MSRIRRQADCQFIATAHPPPHTSINRLGEHVRSYPAVNRAKEQGTATGHSALKKDKKKHCRYTCPTQISWIRFSRHAGEHSARTSRTECVQWQRVFDGLLLLLGDLFRGGGCSFVLYGFFLTLQVYRQVFLCHIIGGNENSDYTKPSCGSD